MQQDNNNTATQVQKLLKWTEQEHSQFIYDCGLAYLTYYIKDEAEVIISHMIRSRIFWNWWKANFRLRDQAFIDRKIVDLKTETWHLIYKELHDPKTLAAEIYPSGVVLGESYNTMIEQLNKDVLCEA